MKTQITIFIVFIAFFFVSCKTESKSQVEKYFPDSLGVVSDFEDVFTDDEIVAFEKRIFHYEQSTSREIAIVTIDSINPYNNMADFATDLGNEWGIGKADRDNGLLILFSKSLRKIRISTGYGTEKILTDSICENVIDQIIIPEFRKEEYFNGIDKGLSELILQWN